MKSIPRKEIAFLPTPVEAMPRLSAALGGPKLFVKRDDLTGLGFGGNKTRKLEFLLADAEAQGAGLLITAGALQSNHCRQTAAAAARFGFSCKLVLFPAGDNPSLQEPDPSANLLLDHLFGAEVVLGSRSQRDEILLQTFEEARISGRRPYMIPYGGSNPFGAYAYMLAIQEFMSQGLEADWIVFPSSSGGTHAGLALGAHLFHFSGKVLGISVDEPEDELKKNVADLANRTAQYLDESVELKPEDIHVDAGYTGGGYGIMGQNELEAIRLFARQEGLLLDPVYTGRAAAGLIDLISKGFFRPDEKVVFWHTGGTPALFADQYRSRLS